MKLRYAASMQADGIWILSNEVDRRRVEIHLLSNGDQATFSLLFLAGCESQQPDRHKAMGPLHSRHSAQATLNAVIAELTDAGYRQLDRQQSMQRPAIWRLQAMKLLRGIRQERDAHAVDCSFVPLGVLPDRRD